MSGRGASPGLNLLLTGRPGIGKTTVIAGAGFIAEVRARRDVTIVEVTVGNRDRLPSEFASRLGV